MKKSLLIIVAVLATCSLLAVGFINRSESTAGNCQTEPLDQAIELQTIDKNVELDFMYNISSRFAHVISKEDLHGATTMLDLLSEEARQKVVECFYTKIVLLDEGEKAIEEGQKCLLTPEQLTLLNTMDYGTDFYIHINYRTKNNFTGLSTQDDEMVYYKTVIPEQEATYAEGAEGLLAFLKENSSAQRATMQPEEVRPGRIVFKVTKAGVVDEVELLQTSGSESMDEKLQTLILQTSNKWQPATNSDGETRDQLLHFTFGKMGC